MNFSQKSEPGWYISYLSLKSNFETELMELNGCGTKLLTLDLVSGQKMYYISTKAGARYSLE